MNLLFAKVMSEVPSYSNIFSFFCLPHQRNSIMEMFLPLSYFWHSTLNQRCLMECSVCVCFLFALSLLNLCAFSAAHFPSVWFAWSLVFICHKRKYSKCMKRNTFCCKIWLSYSILFKSVCFNETVVRACWH